MKLPHEPADAHWEDDAVWKLLDEAPRVTAGPCFAADTVRAARLLEPEMPWWSRLFSPAPLAGMTAAAAAIALAAVAVLSPSAGSVRQTAALDSPQAEAIQEIAETETLIAAADQLDDFSDTELVSLIGF